MSRCTDDYIDNLRREMRRRKWSQEKLSDACGLSRQTISLHLTGKVIPTIDSVHQIAAGLGVPPAVLLMTRDERQRYDMGDAVYDYGMADDVEDMARTKTEAPAVYAAILTVLRYGRNAKGTADIAHETSSR